jgi:fructokinase
VRAALGAHGDAAYTIATDVAWDRIVLTPAALDAAQRARGVVFGSLALRSPENRASLTELWSALPSDAVRVFDVNLRPPHDDLALVRRFSADVTLLKLNAYEAARLVGAVELPGEEETYARRLLEWAPRARICITAGGRGAGWLVDGRWYWEPGRSVAVMDTVGSGDAFLARLLAADHLPPDKALATACRLGEWVATCRGATSPYDDRTPQLNH